jgi:microcystin-dependent protein
MENYISQIIYLPFSWNTEDTMVCRGQILEVKNHEALFSLLGSRWGGDGHSTFALPDLRPFNDAGPDYGKRTRREWHEDEIVPHIVLEGYYPSRV